MIGMECSTLLTVQSLSLSVKCVLLILAISVYVIDEPANPGTTDNSLVTMANFTIMRHVAALGEAMVYWGVTIPTSDIGPANGSVLFEMGVTSRTFQVSAQADMVRRSMIVLLLSIL